MEGGPTMTEDGERAYFDWEHRAGESWFLFHIHQGLNPCVFLGLRKVSVSQASERASEGVVGLRTRGLDTHSLLPLRCPSLNTFGIIVIIMIITISSSSSG